MIRFNPALLTTEIVYLKTVTTSLGGAITILDETRSTKTKEVLVRKTVPMAIARNFIMKTMKITKYLKPVLVAIVRYGDHVIAMERHPLAGLGVLEEETENGIRRWAPQVELNVRTVVKPLVTRGDKDWFFDGRYLYAFNSRNVEANIEEGTHLTADGRFRQVMCTTVDLQSLDDADKLAVKERSCMSFSTRTGVSAISPPIWKDLSSVGSASGSDEDDEGFGHGNVSGSFDKIDAELSVNLNFILKAGSEIGKTFGFEYVQPLQLPRLMIELHTVNLPNVPQAVKATYDSGISFTHGMAWLLGMSRKANSLETYITMRSLMKYLTKRGLFRRDVFDASTLFREGKSIADVGQLDVSDVATNPKYATLNFEALADAVIPKTFMERGHTFAIDMNDDEEEPHDDFVL